MKKQKENSHENITWSEMGKQNEQAKKSHYAGFFFVFFCFCFLLFQIFVTAIRALFLLTKTYLLVSGVQQAPNTQGGSVFYVTGTTKQELFNTAEKTKESSVDDVTDLAFQTLNVSPPDSSPDSFHEVPVDCPEEVPVGVPANKAHTKKGHRQVIKVREKDITKISTGKRTHDGDNKHTKKSCLS